VTRIPSGFSLRQDGKTLEVRVESSVRFTSEIEDVSAPRNPQDSPNPGLKRIVIRLKTAAQSDGNLAVRALPQPQ
jgi:hypothetical protein